MNVPDGIRVRIATPDAASAFLLERRLLPRHPSTLVHGDAWSVELCAHATEELPEIEAAVARWLRESSVEATTIDYDGGLRQVEVRA